MVAVANCPLYEVVYCCAGSNETKVSVGIAGCPLLRGFECIEVYGDVIRTFRIVDIISQVSAIEGCPLSGV